jgi:hypothetical protein
MRSFLFFLLLSLPFYSFSQNDFFIYDEYEITPLHTGVQGLEIVKVYSKCKNPKDCFEKAKKIALQSIIFQGIKGSSSAESMINYLELNSTQKDFFFKFFQKEYLRYVSSDDGSSIAQGDFRRQGKFYKIGYTLKIEKSELRKYLEINNIIRKLGL